MPLPFAVVEQRKAPFRRWFDHALPKIHPGPLVAACWSPHPRDRIVRGRTYLRLSRNGG